ncbi:MAG: AtpZ/AtpI family protein [Balneolaceae bacterium]|nr:AtpZ/AtpI family protein [Balneolaceae bacterium]
MANNFVPRKYRVYLGLGLEIAVSIAFPIFLGYLADQYFDTAPWVTLSGIVVGIITFIFTVLRISKRTTEEEG